jgi:hypothetical protein
VPVQASCPANLPRQGRREIREYAKVLARRAQHNPIFHNMRTRRRNLQTMSPCANAEASNRVIFTASLVAESRLSFSKAMKKHMPPLSPLHNPTLLRWRKAVPVMVDAVPAVAVT